ncbi:hypothetical protein [Nocardioides jishulii]|uniref:Uncharacterized protein n=1 Tax=Nocardioides jishulii TaxID=2575440 RepID=A0A4U2YNQ3_9ACTN|nr:hypothetical protein [Nocardioides jishulii]QCX27813.1 hypothetical protein FCL41_09985 [Nocardioides jishulii]TKI62620.1 hypothetical protein FC770_09650 [Nocardioides jishulii]
MSMRQIHHIPRPSLPRRPGDTVGFLERNPRTGTALTLLLLVLIGVAIGTSVGLAVLNAAQWLVGLVASS